MGKSAEPSAVFVQELAGLCEEVAKQGFTIDELKALWGLFGSWSIIVIKGHQAIRFWWDGRDKYMTVEGSPKRNLSAPNEWKDVCSAAPDDPRKWVIDYLKAQA